MEKFPKDPSHWCDVRRSSEHLEILEPNFTFLLCVEDAIIKQTNKSVIMYLMTCIVESGIDASPQLVVDAYKIYKASTKFI